MMMDMGDAASVAALLVPAYAHAPNSVTGMSSPTLVTIGGTRSDINNDDNALDERTRKRARTEDPDSGSDEVMALISRTQDDTATFVEGSSGDTDAVRDEQYYLPHGDCVIRVEDTLFKVHRFLLARDSSAFEHMFSMPGHEDQQSRIWAEGSSDARPIVLHGESATNFRALLSVMYALPAELNTYTTQHSQIPTLLTIAQTTNKYHFSTTEHWAVNALYNVLTSRTPPHRHYDLSHCKPSLLRRVVEVALLCQHVELRDFAIERWIQRIMAREISPLAAMNVADEFGLARLKGISYYAMLLASDDTLRFKPDAFDSDSEDSDTDAETQDSDPSHTPSSTLTLTTTLTPQQKACLLSGHYSLTHLWRRVTLNVPTFDKPPGCTYHAHGCLSTWRAVWGNVVRSEQTARYLSVDIIGRLRSVDTQLVADPDLQCSLTPACRRAAMESVRALCREIQDGLAGHFVDLTR